jgi:hypothetical protein
MYPPPGLQQPPSFVRLVAIPDKKAEQATSNGIVGGKCLGCRGGSGGCDSHPLTPSTGKSVYVLPTIKGQAETARGRHTLAEVTGPSWIKKSRSRAFVGTGENVSQFVYDIGKVVDSLINIKPDTKVVVYTTQNVTTPNDYRVPYPSSRKCGDLMADAIAVHPAAAGAFIVCLTLLKHRTGVNSLRLVRVRGNAHGWWYLVSTEHVSANNVELIIDALYAANEGSFPSFKTLAGVSTRDWGLSYGRSHCQRVSP